MLSRSLLVKRMTHSAQRGLSTVELMVGVAIGLIIVAGAALMMSSQLADNRRLLIETQLQQDMRIVLHTISRELRRAGYASSMSDQVWAEGKTISQNSSGVITPTTGTGIDDITFKYTRREGEENIPFRFVLSDGVVKMNVLGTLQSLTDASTMVVDSLDIDFDAATPYQLQCPLPCDAAGSTACWPTVQQRTATVTLTAHSATDIRVIRSLSSRVRIRNDWTQFNAADMCPLL